MENIPVNQQTSMPRIGDNAPAFKAVTTQGEINFPEQYADNEVSTKGVHGVIYTLSAPFNPDAYGEKLGAIKSLSEARC